MGYCSAFLPLCLLSQASSTSTSLIVARLALLPLRFIAVLTGDQIWVTGDSLLWYRWAWEVRLSVCCGYPMWRPRVENLSALYDRTSPELVKEKRALAAPQLELWRWAEAAVTLSKRGNCIMATSVQEVSPGCNWSCDRWWHTRSQVAQRFWVPPGVQTRSLFFFTNQIIMNNFMIYFWIFQKAEIVSIFVYTLKYIYKTH